MKKTLGQISDFLQGDCEGDKSTVINDVAEIEFAKSGDITFLGDPRYRRFLKTTRASAIVISKGEGPVSIPAIRVDNPSEAFLRLIDLFRPEREEEFPSVHPTALIGEDTILGKGISIGAYAVIGRNCVIGDGVKIFPSVIVHDDVRIGDCTVIYGNVTIYERCKIGSRVLIHAGTVIGSHGFGFLNADGKLRKIPQTGTVRIEDDVEIGANCTVDRASLGETIIHKGTKLDNLIHVAHNVRIGSNTAIAAQVGIAGSTVIGKNVLIGGQAGFVDHISIGDNSSIGSQAGVTKSHPSGSVLSGYPAKEHREAKKEEAYLRQIPRLVERIKKIEEKIERIKSLKG
ncbi:MAG: UDP-3-O-(3-hydroxymyristoyl)glucosamine N-acyltransferase [Fidelibacterota bacterium]